MVLLISYDLISHERPGAYSAVKSLIERNAVDFRRPLYSQFLVQTPEGVDTWTNRLRQVIDSGDKLLIVPVHQRVNGWLDEETWAWINARI